MKDRFVTLLADIKSRGWRAWTVVALVATSMAAIMPEAQDLPGAVCETVWLIAAIGVWFIIRSDSLRDIRSTKSAVYGTLIMSVFWLTTVVEMIVRLARNQSLLHWETKHFADGSMRGAKIEFAPVFLATGFVLTFIISGIIAYHIGKQRKDIKGVKNRDLFR